MIEREALATLQRLTKGFPVIGITGPRQSGKTTLAKAFFKDKRYVSLEEPDQLEFAQKDPKRFLEQFTDGAVLDEAQRAPHLFSYIQTWVDQKKKMGEFVLTGSQQFGLYSSMTQSLAGRLGLLHLLPFSFSELKKAAVHFKSLDQMLFQGFYPALYDRLLLPSDWYANYVQTYVERDIRQVIQVRNLGTFQKFLRLCAARSGQLLNLSNLGNECGIKHNTAHEWLNVLEASYIVFRLCPHFQNFSKRLIKSPKLYFYDCGLAAWLLGIRKSEELPIHPMRAQLFETWIISELTKAIYHKGLMPNLYFWRDHIGNEIDIIVDKSKMLLPIEIKSGSTLVSDFFLTLNRWKQWAGSSSETPCLIYGGEENQKRSNVEIFSWRHIDALIGRSLARNGVD